jgi:hypothetical protein
MIGGVVVVIWTFCRVLGGCGSLSGVRLPRLGGNGGGVSCDVGVDVESSAMGEREWLGSGGRVEKERLCVSGGGSALVVVFGGAKREMFRAMAVIIVDMLARLPWIVARAAADSA